MAQDGTDSTEAAEGFDSSTGKVPSQDNQHS